MSTILLSVFTTRSVIKSTVDSFIIAVVLRPDGCCTDGVVLASFGVPLIISDDSGKINYSF